MTNSSNVDPGLENSLQPNLMVEPTVRDIANEESFLTADSLDSGGRSKKSKNKNNSGKSRPKSGQADPLAKYLDQLSHIPLFTPEQESNNARDMRELEISAWSQVLQTPKAIVHLLELLEAEANDPDTTGIKKLITSYRQAAAKTNTLTMSPKRLAVIQELAIFLRDYDCDKVLLENVVRKIRGEVWSPSLVDDMVIFRITQQDLERLEQARGLAMRARNSFVRANLRLVVSVAKRFQNRKIPFIDLVQEGNLGLLKAVHRFDHLRGYRFSTYAHWWIRQSIERAIINKGSQVRLPVHVIDSRRQIARATAELQKKLERKPSIEEIAQKVELSEEKVDTILQGVHPDPVSLDDSVGDSDNRKFLDMVRDMNRPAIDEALIWDNTMERVRDLMKLLNPMERDIIVSRFGLGSDSDQTLDEIGRRYNLSRERVRQIQVQGLAKMRRMCDRRQISRT